MASPLKIQTREQTDKGAQTHEPCGSGDTRKDETVDSTRSPSPGEDHICVRCGGGALEEIESEIWLSQKVCQNCFEEEAEHTCHICNGMGCEYCEGGTVYD